MAKIDPNFPHDMFSFLHRPLRIIDRDQGRDFLERFLLGPQQVFEDTQKAIRSITDILDPALTRSDLLVFLKDEVGFTKELDNITRDLSEDDLRKLISVAIPLWKKKGTEPGYEDIVRLFTGKGVRSFNYFDFRLIVGEKAFGEEQLGEDSWLISIPGVEAAQDAANNVVDLLTFEGNFKDRSLTGNEALGVGSFSFFSTPASGFPQGSETFVRLSGGHICQSNSSRYDLSGDFTIEMFLRTSTTQSGRILFQKKSLSGKEVTISIDTATDTINYVLDDGSVVVSDSLIASGTIADGFPKHLALVLDRSQGARLYFNGTDSSSLQALGALGDLSNIGEINIGGTLLAGSNFLGDLDNFRLSLNDAYDITAGTITPPLSGFIEFIEEQLDEFFTDVRVVDEGDLNKILMLRILNLMRPASERLNVIFIRFFDDFTAGTGRFVMVAGTSLLTVDDMFQLFPQSFAVTDVLGDEDFQNIVLQIKANDFNAAGGVMSVIFNFQDSSNFYEYRIDTANKLLSLHKTIAGSSIQIAPDVAVDIVPKASYIFTLQTSFNPMAGETRIHTFLDSNRIHVVDDSSFEKGKFGMKTGFNTIMQVDEIEMLVIPIDIRKVLPGFDL